MDEFLWILVSEIIQEGDKEYEQRLELHLNILIVMRTTLRNSLGFLAHAKIDCHFVLWYTTGLSSIVEISTTSMYLRRTTDKHG